MKKVSIGDDSTQIVGCVERALGESDIAIITGGLGPTKDDITKKTLAEMFGSELVPDQRVADHVKRMLEERGIEFNDLNRGQALVPACCTVLFNAHGTAPGMWFERGGKVVVSLPGVPYEMEHLMQDEVMPRLKAHFELRQIVHRTMITAGLPESMLAQSDRSVGKRPAALPEAGLPAQSGRRTAPAVGLRGRGRKRIEGDRTAIRSAAQDHSPQHHRLRNGHHAGADTPAAHRTRD